MILNQGTNDNAPQASTVLSPDSDRAFSSESAQRWSTPGLIMSKQLETETDVWAIHETVLSDGTYYVTVAVSRRDKGLTFLVFDAERAARECFPKLKIDVLVSTTIRSDDLPAMQTTGLFHLVREVA